MKVVLGTMNIGQQVFGQTAAGMLQAYKEAGGTELDTAYVYNDGDCERQLGKCFALTGKGDFLIATKANPRVSGVLDHSAVTFQLNGSLARMGLSYVDIFYLHFPDRNTSIQSAIEGCAELYRQGKFKELGISNFPLNLAETLGSICDELGCPRPSVYEGVYNVLSRKAEAELFPALDDLGMRFYAYNPLAGGMLSGKYHNIEEEPDKGRFALRSKSYKSRYWKRSYFQALRLIDSACKEYEIPVAEAAYRWLVCHSSLEEKRKDAVIIGASCLEQLSQNMRAVGEGPLPPRIVEAMEAAWDITAHDAPEYFRYYEKPKGSGN